MAMSPAAPSMILLNTSRASTPRSPTPRAEGSRPTASHSAFKIPRLDRRRLAASARNNLGYFGINNGEAFELNIYALAPGGVGIGFGTNGPIANPYQSVAPVNLANGDPINVNLYYMGGVMQLSLTDTVVTASFVTNVTLADYGAVVGQSVGYVGFTGADGGSVSSQQVSNFAFVPAAPPALSVANQGGLLHTSAGQVEF